MATPIQERVGRVGQRRQVVIPKELLETLNIREGDFVAFSEQANGVLIKPKRLLDPEDTLLKLLDPLHLIFDLLSDADLVDINLVDQLLKLFDELDLIEMPALTILIPRLRASVINIAVHVSVLLFLQFFVSLPLDMQLRLYLN